MGETTGSSVPDSMPDSALAVRFTNLLDAYQAPLVAFVFGLVGERELARDVIQETYIAAWRAAVRQEAPFRDPCDEEGSRRWLFAVAYRQAALALRHERRFLWQSLNQDGPDEAAATTPDIAQRVVEADALRAALSALSPVDAACFFLQTVHGFSTEEIAAVVHVRSSTVRKRLSRARQRLRAAYAAQLTTPSTTPEGQRQR